MTIEELTSRLDQAWEEIKQYRETVRWIARHGRIPAEAVGPGADPAEIADLESRIIRACATIVATEILYRERTGGGQ